MEWYKNHEKEIVDRDGEISFFLFLCRWDEFSAASEAFLSTRENLDVGKFQLGKNILVWKLKARLELD